MNRLKAWRKKTAEAWMDNGYRGHGKPWVKPKHSLHKYWWHYSDGWPFRLEDEPKPKWMPEWLFRWITWQSGPFAEGGRLENLETHPMWVWRPYCWFRGCHIPFEGHCVTCGKKLR